MRSSLILSLVFLQVGLAVYGLETPEHLKDEGHAIAKRFADPDYEFHGHDVAYVLHERQPDTFHRIKRRDLSSVTNGHNDVKRLRLDLNSGESLHLSLKKRSVVDATTEIYHNTEDGLVKREAMASDCYATGHVGDDSGNIASVAMCDGLHGTLIGNGMEYYIHPLNEDEEDHRVHVLWRRQADNNDDNNDDEGVTDDDDDYITYVKSRKIHEFDAWKTSDKMEIEMAMFTDARFWARLQDKVPGREDEYNIISMNAVQAMYGDKNKVGYDFRITVKVMVNWQVDPENYTFVEDLKTNLNTFCRLVRHDYHYDMLFLNTGIIHQDGPASGMAYVGGICGSHRCGCGRSAAPNRMVMLAHEIGHNLGFAHHDAATCPDDIKSVSGGFMGGGSRLSFSPCNKWELRRLFESGKGKCMFEETGKRKVPKSFVDLPRILPGQFKSPDYLCEIYAGPGYIYYTPHQLQGNDTCEFFLCLNTNENSPSFENIIKFEIPVGFPCGDEMYCFSSSKCESWDSTRVGWDAEYLRENKQTNKWSNWSKKWSKCSRTCGTGIQTKTRYCKVKKGPFLTPYCTGPSIKFKACATDPCSGDPETIEEIRQIRGDETCSQFFNNDVKLDLDEESTYLPTSKKFESKKYSNLLFPSKSCILSCQRDPDTNNMVDGLMPSGTPCLENKRSEYDLNRFNIEMRCVKGECVEFSDCPSGKEKDNCGICGGSEKRCKSSIFTDDVPEGDRVVLATIPAGSSSINVHVVKFGGKLELWDSDDQLIFGEGGQYPKTKYVDEKVVDYADTIWSLHANQFIRSEGKTKRDVVVKLLGTASPVKRVEVTYFLKKGGKD